MEPRPGWAAWWVMALLAAACEGEPPAEPSDGSGNAGLALAAEGSATEAVPPGTGEAAAGEADGGTAASEGSGSATGAPIAEGSGTAPWSWPSDFVLDLAQAVLDEELGELVVPLADGHRVVLTLDADLQRHLTGVVQRYAEPFETVVVVEPQTGRVLAWIEDRNADLFAYEHPLQRADAYAASIFKIVTAAALVEEVNLGFDRRMCVPPGASGVEEADLVSDEARDTRCVDFAGAMAESVNAYFARLANDHLTAELMERWIERFGFNEVIPFEIPVEPSPADVPEAALERARMAAGFRHANLSPLHAALIAAAVANGGVMMTPTLVDRVLDAAGEVVYERESRPWRQVMSAETAQVLTRVMADTTTTGTASRYFAEREGWPTDLRVAGKTGTLSNRTQETPNPDPVVMYTWFVGFAPIEAPTMAVSSLVTNTERWYIKGSYLASEAIIRRLRGPGR